jgi:hypothetical protein
MALQGLDEHDWGHRLGILAAWRHVLALPPLLEKEQNPRLAATYEALYGATLDGCAITIRALCYGLEISYDFKPFDEKASNRRSELERCISKGKKSVAALTTDAEEQRCLLEVLFPGNRAVAHPFQGKLPPHQVRGGIDRSQTNQLPELKKVYDGQPSLFAPLPIDRPQPQPSGLNPP